MRSSAKLLLIPGLCALSLTACDDTKGGVAAALDSAVMPKAEAAPPVQASRPAPIPRTEKNELWTEYAPGAELPAGITPMPSLAPLVKQVKPGVVNISTTSVVRLRPRAPQGSQDPFEEFFRRFAPEESRRQSLGSGFIIHPDGYVVTNNHVVDNATEIKVKLDDGREFSARVVGRDPKTDLALLKLEDGAGELHNLPIESLGNSDILEVGDFVLAVGNPFGLDHSVSLGIVSAKERVIGAGPYDEFIQTDAAINPGNSGGPLFNTRGEVIGVNTAIVAQGQGIGFAVPINVVKELLPQLSEKGRVVRGWLGVTIQDVTPDLAKSLKLARAQGVLVAGVMPGSPAEKADLRAGDVVVSVNGRRVDTFNQLSRYVAYVAPGGKATLNVIRDGKEKTIDVTVTERTEDVEQAGATGPGQDRSGAVKPDKLGLAVQPIPPRFGQRVEGVQIAAVAPGSAAAKAGVSEGDILVELQRKPIRSVKDYAAVMATVKSGDLALMRLQRENASLYKAIQVP